MCKPVKSKDGFPDHIECTSVLHRRRLEDFHPPSGTEPKIKFYIEVRGTMKSKADYAEAIKAAEAKTEMIKKNSESDIL